MGIQKIILIYLVFVLIVLIIPIKEVSKMVYIIIGFVVLCLKLLVIKELADWMDGKDVNCKKK